MEKLKLVLELFRLVTPVLLGLVIFILNGLRTDITAQGVAIADQSTRITAVSERLVRVETVLDLQPNSGRRR